MNDKAAKGFTAEEEAAMQERARELKASSRRGKPERADGERDVQEKIAKLTGSDRSIAERVHAIVTTTAPELWPRLWYGSPAYALDGKVIVFFQESAKFKTRYCTLGFSDSAKLDDGAMWPNSYAVADLTPADEERIAALVRKAVG